MSLGRIWERATELVATFRAVWLCISASLGEFADGLKAERVQEPAAPDVAPEARKRDTADTGSEGSGKSG